jgi:alpha-glucosidase
MEQICIPPNRVQDPFEKLVGGYGLNRDPQRAPMRWDSTSAAGFTSGEPWLPLGENVAERNVATLQADDHSLLWLYRRLIRLRRAEPPLMNGDYVPMCSRNDIVVYKRSLEGKEILVALNTVHQPRKLEWQGVGTLLLSTYLDGEGKTIGSSILLRADEGVIVRIQ